MSDIKEVVTGIQGYAVSEDAPEDGEILTWNEEASEWQSIVLAGDITGNPATTVVEKINGATVPVAGDLTTGNVLQVSGDSELIYGPVVLTGDVNGTNEPGWSNTVGALQNIPLGFSAESLGSNEDQYILMWDNPNQSLKFNKPNNVGGFVLSTSGDVDGYQPFNLGGYYYTWIEITAVSWTSSHTMSFYPIPATKFDGFYKTIFNNTSYTVTVATSEDYSSNIIGTTRTLASGLAQMFWFDDNGVSNAGATFTP